LVTRQERIDDFIHEGEPPIDQPLQILCEDHNGTYVIPFFVPLARRRVAKRENQPINRSYGDWLAGT
jgi:hypothetical protein